MTSSPYSPRNYSSLGPPGGARFHPSTIYRVRGLDTKNSEESDGECSMKRNGVYLWLMYG